MAYRNGSFMKFVADFLLDEQFRFAVLYQENTAMADRELTPGQRSAIRRLCAREIVQCLQTELGDIETQWQTPLGTLQREVHLEPAPECAAAAGPASATVESAAAYTQDQTFFLDPPRSVAPNEEVTLKGLNFGPEAWICFSLCPGEAEADKQVVKARAVTVDADLYQHVQVKVPALPSGTTWMLYGGYGNHATLREFVGETRKRGKVTIK